MRVTSTCNWKRSSYWHESYWILEVQNKTHLTLDRNSLWHDGVRHKPKHGTHISSGFYKELHCDHRCYGYLSHWTNKLVGHSNLIHAMPILGTSLLKPYQLYRAMLERNTSLKKRLKEPRPESYSIIFLYNNVYAHIYIYIYISTLGRFTWDVTIDFPCPNRAHVQSFAVSRCTCGSIHREAWKPEEFGFPNSAESPGFSHRDWRIFTKMEKNGW